MNLIALDLLAGVLAAVGWLGAGAALATGRHRVALGLLAVAVLATAGRLALVIPLVHSGWWFVQEKLTLGLPLALAGAFAAALARSAVALLTAGYAAVASLLVTLFIGYPASVADALVMVTLVGGASLLTWRVLAPEPSPVRLRLSAIAAATGVIGGALTLVPAGQAQFEGGTPVTALRGPDTGGTVRPFTLTAATGTVTLSSGHRVSAWAYNGQAPGPALTAAQGDLIEVTLHNTDIRAGVTIHWHGYDVPSGEDGAPGLTQEAVLPGQEFVYRFRADQAGTYWYHTHEVSSRGVRMGLYGTLVVTPRAAPPSGLDLTLPVHRFGAVTDIGQADRRHVAPGTPVRLRLVNTDSSTHRLALSGATYRLAAVDGTDLHEPGPLTSTAVRLAAGGRYDFVFTMPAGPVALLVDDDPHLRLDTGNTGKFAGSAGWPTLDLTRYGTPAPTPFGTDSHFDRRFTLVLDRGLTRSGYAYTINGRAFPRVPTQFVAVNDLVEMTVVNRGLDTHPWHLHGHHVLLLSRDGDPVRGSPLWWDTFEVRPGEVWRVAFRATNPGLWMNHCHNLPHADQGMSLHLAYEGITTPFHGTHGLP